MNRLIRIERPPNDRVRSFHINRVVSHSVIEHFMRPVRGNSEKYLIKVGDPGADVVRSLMRLSGVTDIFIKPYEVSVHISEVHDWDSLEPSVLRVLCTKVFGTDPNDVQIER